MLRTPALTLLLAATLSPVPAQQPVYHAAVEPAQDPALAQLPGGAMLALPGLFPDFVHAGGGQLVELPNGTARLTGRVFSQGSLYSAFLVDIVFAGRVAPGNSAYPPAGSPDLQLQPGAYVPLGPVDPAMFVYYTQATGTLTGVRNFDGAVFALQLATPAAQLGLGANNRNGQLGLEATFQVTVLRQPAVPVPVPTSATLVVDLPAAHTDKATHPEPDPTRTTLAAGRALVLPGVADDYVFVPAGDFTEYDDGHAELHGTLARLTQLDDAWDLALVLTSRLDPGEPGHPPAGSPVLQMLPQAYVAGGGTLDPGHWRYYQTGTGTLTGRGLNAGGSVALASGGALQCGGGANQANTYWGCYGAFTATVTAQPTARTIAITGAAELFPLCAVFPVLPFPVLTPPAVPHALPTLTDQGILVQGDNFAWIDYAGVDFDLLGRGGPERWFAGWFRVLDNRTIEVHPRPGAAPGTYALSVFNPAVRSNALPLQLSAPATPVLYAEAAVSAFGTLHVHVHSGSVTGPALSAIGMSASLAPTVYPGIAALGIGSQGAALTVVPGSFAHAAGTGIARFDFGPIPPWFTGFQLHFQAVTLDLAALALPLPTTNVWSVAF